MRFESAVDHWQKYLRRKYPAQNSDKPERITNEMISYFDADGKIRQKEAKIMYYGAFSDPILQVEIPIDEPKQDECICRSLL